jgi:hypothetical protein
MAVRKLGAVEVTTVRAPLLRQFAPTDEATAIAAQYVAALDHADGLEGHRIYWGQVSRFLTADERYEHVYVLDDPRGLGAVLGSRAGSGSGRGPRSLLCSRE